MKHILDTGIILSMINPRDPNHRLVQTNLQRLARDGENQFFTIDAVIVDGLNFLASIARNPKPSKLFVEALEEIPWQISLADHHVLAKEIHFKHYGQGISYTDSLLLAWAKSSRAQILTTDETLARVAGES